MSAVFDLTQDAHVVNALPPLDINVAAQTTDWINLNNYQAVFFVLSLGVTGAASTITVEEATSSAGVGNTAIDFQYRAEEVASGDTLGNWTAAVAATGFNTSLNDGVFYVIKVASSQLSEGSNWVAVQLSDPGVITFGQVSAICVGPRYHQNDTPSAIV